MPEQLYIIPVPRLCGQRYPRNGPNWSAELLLLLFFFLHFSPSAVKIPRLNMKLKSKVGMA